LSPVLVMISSMSVLICDRFRANRANNGKKLLEGIPFSCFHPKETYLFSGTKFCYKKTTVLQRQSTVKIPWF